MNEPSTHQSGTFPRRRDSLSDLCAGGEDPHSSPAAGLLAHILAIDMVHGAWQRHAPTELALRTSITISLQWTEVDVMSFVSVGYVAPCFSRTHRSPSEAVDVSWRDFTDDDGMNVHTLFLDSTFTAGNYAGDGRVFGTLTTEDRSG